VVPDTSLAPPISDSADVAVVQTALAGEADIICTVDADFYDETITRFLSQAGIKVLDDIGVMQMLRDSAEAAGPC
jgi:hypothetical protein